MIFWESKQFATAQETNYSICIGSLMHTLKCTLFITIVLFLFFIPNQAEAATIVVAQNGSGNVTTIQSALTMAKPGDVVAITSGTYTGDSMSPIVSGTAALPITIKKYATTDRVIIQGSFRINGINFIVFDGLEFTGGTTGSYAGIYLKNTVGSKVENVVMRDISHYFGILIEKGERNIIRNNKISGAAIGIGIGGIPPIRYNIAEKNELFNNERDCFNADGLQVFEGAEFNIIRDNISHNNCDDGFDMWNSSYNILSGNKSYQNGYYTNGSMGGDGNGFKLGGQKNGYAGGGNFVSNNVAYDNKAVGFTTNGGPKANTLIYNTAYKNAYGFEEWSGSGGSLFLDNISFGNIRMNVTFSSDAKSQYNLTVPDPLFVNRDGGDFHLQSASPARNFGVLVTANTIPSIFTSHTEALVRDEAIRQIAIDFDKKTRAAADVGAFAYAGSVQPSPTVTQTPTLRPTATPLPTTLPSVTPVATVAPSPAAKMYTVRIIFGLHGIGKGGDNVNSSAEGMGDPIRKNREIVIDFYNASNTLAKTIAAQAAFTNGLFAVDIPSVSLVPGYYTVRLRSPNYLSKRLYDIIAITSQNTVISVPQVAFITGDINNDDRLNIFDYNMLLDCYTDIEEPKNCLDEAKKLASDLSDDGSVNHFDYNLLLRELSVQVGP